LFFFWFSLGWSAIINALEPDGVSDYLITILVLSFFVLGFFVGHFQNAYYVGIFCLGFLGGVSLGVRLVILRPNLLIQGNALSRLNWLIAIFLGLLGVLGVFYKKTSRVALVGRIVSLFFSFLVDKKYLFFFLFSSSVAHR